MTLPMKPCVAKPIGYDGAGHFHDIQLALYGETTDAALHVGNYTRPMSL